MLPLIICHTRALKYAASEIARILVKNLRITARSASFLPLCEWYAVPLIISKKYSVDLGLAFLLISKSSNLAAPTVAAPLCGRLQAAIKIARDKQHVTHAVITDCPAFRLGVCVCWAD